MSKVVISILIALLLVLVTTGLSFMMAENNDKRNDCLKTISDSFCLEKGLLSRVDSMVKFYCIEEERLVNGKKYMFTPEEVNSCQSFGENRR